MEVMRSEPCFCKHGDKVFHKSVPQDCTVQLLQQVTVSKPSLSTYVVEYETSMLYTVFCRVTNDIRQGSLAALLRVVSGVVSWAHVRSRSRPQFVTGDLLEIVQSCIQFWYFVNNHVEKIGSFVPLKQHETQSFYFKTKGGKDGARQYRAVLQSSRSHFSWELRIFLKVLKILAVNSFSA